MPVVCGYACSGTQGKLRLKILSFAWFAWRVALGEVVIVWDPLITILSFAWFAWRVASGEVVIESPEASDVSVLRGFAQNAGLGEASKGLERPRNLENPASNGLATSFGCVCCKGICLK